MTPTQREAALRLADNMDLSLEAWMDQAATMLRELAAEPQGEPAAWIQPDHLQKARVAPFLCRVEPTKRMSDFVPLYAHPPQQRKPLSDEQINRLDTEAIHGGPDSQYAFRFARAVEKAHGITGEQE